MGEMTSKTEIRDLARLVANGHGGAVLAEFRDRARAAGVEGRSGGWIYLSSAASRPIGQGWSALATFLLDGLGPAARKLLAAMGEASAADAPRRLSFTAAGLTNKEATAGATAYEAEAEGVKYRVVGSIIPGQLDGRRSFRAYRVVGTNGHSLTAAGEGGEHKTRAAAYAQAERDLVDVLRDRAAADKPAERIEYAGSHPFRPGTADPSRCGFPDCNGPTTSPNHHGWAPREVTFPTPICPDAEAGKPHPRHRIDGTWREQCPGVGRVDPDRPGALADPAGLSTWLTGKLAGHVAGRHVGRSCCASTEGDVHDRSCQTSEAREQWAPRGSRPAPPAPIREALDRVSAAAYEAVDAALAAASAAGPQTDPATDDDVTELLDRIVRRAQYDALRAVRRALAGWMEGARANGSPAYGEYDVFHSSDIGRMINDAARELGVPEPMPELGVGRRLDDVALGPQFRIGDRVYPRSGGEVVTVERVADIEGSGGRQQFWSTGNTMPKHSDEYQLAPLAGAGR